MMLTLYRRHLKRCSKCDDHYWKHCSCPSGWRVRSTTLISGAVFTPRVRNGHRDSRKRSNPADDPKAPPPVKEAPITLRQAVDEYLADAKARELADSTLAKLETIFKKQFLIWAKAEGYTLLRDMGDATMQKMKQDQTSSVF